MKNFSKKELERLGCTEEEIVLIMEYQKKFPVILDNENNLEKFCVDARTLYLQLKQTIDESHFSRWWKRAVKNYGFQENIDFIMISPIGRIGKNGNICGDLKSINASITVDMAKQLAMVEKTQLGFIARRYFIIMERIVKENKEWLNIRKPERKEYNALCDSVDSYVNRNSNRPADKYDYSRESNILNIISTGAVAQDIRNYFSLDSINELTRDSLTKDYNEKLAFLQKQDMIYLGLNMSVLERVKMLIAAFDVIYPTATPILPWKSKEDMLNARERLLKSLE